MYNDICAEQILKRHGDLSVLGRRILVFFGMVFVILLALYFSPLFGAASFVACGLAIWFGFKGMQLQGIEYEYSLTNGEFDVDMIRGQMSRKHIVSTSCRSFEVFAPVTEANTQKYRLDEMQRIFDCASKKNAPDRWFAVFTLTDGTRGVLYLEPSERMMDAMMPFIPQRALVDQ